jgi:threonine dehydratase
MVTVTTDQLCAAIKHGFNDTRCVLEPAGALGIAGMIKYLSDNGWEGKNVVAIASGANMDFDRTSCSGFDSIFHSRSAIELHAFARVKRYRGCDPMADIWQTVL